MPRHAVLNKDNGQLYVKFICTRRMNVDEAAFTCLQAFTNKSVFKDLQLCPPFPSLSRLFCSILSQGSEFDLTSGFCIFSWHCN